MRFFTRLAKYAFLGGAILTGFAASSQDVHFAQYYTQASSLNPSLVGNYDGSYRLSAIYRNQWGAALGKSAYQTVGADVDFCLLEGYLRTDKLAIGAGFISDRSGAAGLSSLNVALTVAYHKGFGKLGNHRLSVAAQGAYFQRRVDDPLFGDQFINYNQTPSLSSSEQIDRGFYNFDFNAGLYWRSNFKERVRFGLGFAVYHLVEPKQQMIKTSLNQAVMFRRYAADFNLEAFVDKKKRVSISPEFVYMMQGNAKEILPAISATYYFNTGFRNNNSISAGMRFRMGGVMPDAVIPMAQVEFRNIRLGFAYDVNISSLKKSTLYRGAFELSLTYLGESIKSFKANKSLPSRRF
jgi:type IX secretion system PorP/SprF family membrane protein